MTREDLIEFATLTGVDFNWLFGLTWKELHHYAIGYNQREAQRVAPFRVMAYMTFCANLGPKKKAPPITKFWPLYGDPEPMVIDAKKEREEISKLKRIWRNKS